MIKLLLSTDQQYYFTICAKNGRVLATSETYQEKRKAVDAVGKAVHNAIAAAGVDVEVNEIAIIDLTGE